MMDAGRDNRPSELEHAGPNVMILSSQLLKTTGDVHDASATLLVVASDGVAGVGR